MTRVVIYLSMTKAKSKLKFLRKKSLLFFKLTVTEIQNPPTTNKQHENMAI